MRSLRESHKFWLQVHSEFSKWLDLVAWTWIDHQCIYSQPPFASTYHSLVSMSSGGLLRDGHLLDQGPMSVWSTTFQGSNRSLWSSFLANSPGSVTGSISVMNSQNHLLSQYSRCLHLVKAFTYFKSSGYAYYISIGSHHRVCRVGTYPWSWTLGKNRSNFRLAWQGRSNPTVFQNFLVTYYFWG